MAFRILSIACGIWLVLSGLLLQPLAHAPWPQWATGLVLIAGELLALRFEAARVVSFFVGVWLLFAGAVFGYPRGVALVSTYVSALLLLALSTQPTRTPGERGNPLGPIATFPFGRLARRKRERANHGSPASR